MRCNILDTALKSEWAMEEEPLRRLFQIAARQNLDPDQAARLRQEREDRPDAIALQGAQRLAGTERALVRDQVAIIPVFGAIFPRANLMTEMSGAVSCQMLARDVAVATADPNVKSILLEIDSPGGAVDGVRELAGHLGQMRLQKPLHAYVSGTCASAAYWIATACETITVASTARVGSIGVLVALPGANEREIVLVSSQSPRKRPDLGTEEGRGEVQRTLDDLAALFVADVAKGRGVSESTVLSEFGQGGVFVGRRAVRAGMVDRLGTLEGTLRALASGNPPRRRMVAEAEEMDGFTITLPGGEATVTYITAPDPAPTPISVSEEAPAALSFEEQLAGAHDAVRGCIERAESYQRLSRGRWNDLVSLRDSLTLLVEQTEPRASEETRRQLQLQALDVEADALESDLAALLRG